MLPSSTMRMPVRPVDRRDDGGVGQRRPRAVDGGLVGLHLRGVLRDQRALGVGLLLVDGVGGGELLVAREIDLGVGELRFVLRLLGDGLIELRLVGGRIDARQHVAPLDVLAFLEADASNLPSTCGRTVTVLSALTVPTVSR